MSNDDNKQKKATYTKLMPCTPINQLGYECPIGWEPVGYTHPGSCAIGNVPGDGHEDIWKQYGWQRVCKKSVPTSDNIELDCCSNIEGVGDSLECKSQGLTPYGRACNIAMKNHCITRNDVNPYQHNWNGIPNGQRVNVYNGCSQMYYVKNQEPSYHSSSCNADCKYCFEYLRNAPNNNYFSTHDFNEYHHDFPHYSYTTPDFNNLFGYQPMRKPYYAWNDYENKNYNSVNVFYPKKQNQ